MTWSHLEECVLVNGEAQREKPRGACTWGSPGSEDEGGGDWISGAVALGVVSVDPAPVVPGATSAGCWPDWSLATAAGGGSLEGSTAQPAIVAATEAVAISAFTPAAPEGRLFELRCVNSIS